MWPHVLSVKAILGALFASACKCANLELSQPSYVDRAQPCAFCKPQKACNLCVFVDQMEALLGERQTLQQDKASLEASLAAKGAAHDRLVADLRRFQSSVVSMQVGCRGAKTPLQGCTGACRSRCAGFFFLFIPPPHRQRLVNHRLASRLFVSRACHMHYFLNRLTRKQWWRRRTSGWWRLRRVNR